MIQYTSGSTGAPNGVMLSHGNLLHNLEQIRLRFEHTEHSHGLIWLPPYHDMGLIGGILQPLYAGFPVTLMSPMHFLQQPLRWLQAISLFQATTSGGPNFAYELCVERIEPEECEGLDLSTWSVAFTGAEPVRAETLERFVAAFEPFGFRREALYPCYGLAEATLMVSGGSRSAAPVIAHLHSESLENAQVVSVTREDQESRCLVGCGHNLDRQEIVIVDPEHLRQKPKGEVGEIWVRGPSVGQGYWGRPEQSKATFQAYLADSGDGPFLRTGDLGFVKEGELFITGRLKDLIILNGRNLYPQDIERTVEESHPSIRPGCCVAFSVNAQGEERLIVVAEIERTYCPIGKRSGLPTTMALTNGETGTSAKDTMGMQPVVKAVRRAVSDAHEARVAEVLLVRPASLAKTPSGKLQRHACRAAFLGRTLKEVGVGE
jgi:acyl-CoA synthetase (AMP-forming)/AMP-acid ligase II